jgi:hypothetical protein
LHACEGRLPLCPNDWDGIAAVFRGGVEQALFTRPFIIAVKTPRQQCSLARVRTRAGPRCYSIFSSWRRPLARDPGGARPARLPGPKNLTGPPSPSSTRSASPRQSAQPPAPGAPPRSGRSVAACPF